ncbi:hypothetical protein HR060_00250 [Catenovulum sp. SM1970]|uniref:hypothetical protein n=1 Tax=Marinifaba aquimaris TaxID=2741323 RepID=UPI0015741C57|nr:hypothetical protein [Marinifaba aquimaris]NTS75279.1 hypothetical protein [Marinifaba aquimaris]
MEIGSLQSGLNTNSTTSSTGNEELNRQLPSASPQASQVFSNQDDQVSLSPQAQILNQTDKNNQELSEQLETANAQRTISSDFVRVSSSVGEAASSFGLNEQQAIDLYKKINALL